MPEGLFAPAGAPLRTAAGRRWLSIPPIPSGNIPGPPIPGGGGGPKPPKGPIPGPGPGPTPGPGPSCSGGAACTGEAAILTDRYLDGVPVVLRTTLSFSILTTFCKPVFQGLSRLDDLRLAAFLYHSHKLYR